MLISKFQGKYNTNLTKRIKLCIVSRFTKSKKLRQS
jgi:hypothetical protein